ncbi:DUF3644 domain-containing protein [Kiloniella laminariae]|uniref:DUF3644 domain-containing protein n=1 Tax=Kiloniella laminariae TaxID=454162 RepID=UPI0003649177|nr:DUF3644 domain-containing protein [Kiloniella laminariae]
MERWEVALVKTMFDNGWTIDQDILAYFTRPSRSVNHRLIGQIRRGDRYRNVKAASNEELEDFLSNWPDLDTETGLNLKGDELVIKAREAMIAAVHTFNGAGLQFRSELFIVTSNIAWTYLMHAYYRKIGIDYRYYQTREGVRQVVKTREGADKYWELGKCIRHDRCQLPQGTVNNLEALFDIRHEIEHRSTDRIDDALGGTLQQCALNFNDALKDWFGNHYGLEKRLPLALQFGTFKTDQRRQLKAAKDLPRHIATTIDNIYGRLSDEELADPRFTFKVAFVRKITSRANAADEAVEFVRSDSEEAAAINRVLLKETEKPKYLPSRIVDLMKAEGYRWFTMQQHTHLWQTLDAKAPQKGYGVLVAQQWYWYDAWLARVREYCLERQSREA